MARATHPKINMLQHFFVLHTLCVKRCLIYLTTFGYRKYENCESKEKQTLCRNSPKQAKTLVNLLNDN